MSKYKWIKIKDVRGDVYEFEDCEALSIFGVVIIFYEAPIGVVKKFFIKRNLISYEFLTK